MNLTNFNNNTHIWKNVKPFLSIRGSCTSKFNLADKDELISDDSTLAET